MPIPFYRCEKCRREFDSAQGAKACEDGHLTVVSAIIKQYSIHPYPYSLAVTFSDGETRIYNAENMG